MEEIYLFYILDDHLNSNNITSHYLTARYTRFTFNRKKGKVIRLTYDHKSKMIGKIID